MRLYLYYSYKHDYTESKHVIIDYTVKPVNNQIAWDRNFSSFFKTFGYSFNVYNLTEIFA